MKIIFNPLTGKFDYVVNKLTELSTRNHNDLQNRDAADCHPESAVTNLVSDLAAKVNKAGSITQITTRNHNDLQNRDAVGSHSWSSINQRHKPPFVNQRPAAYTWTGRSASEASYWISVVWSPELGLFVAVANTGTNQVMTSPDGINWTSRPALAAEGSPWYSVTWSPELSLFVAVGIAGGTNQVMTSPDGINWTSRSASEASDWYSVTWSPELGLFVAVAGYGTNLVMTSPNGIDWTSYCPAALLPADWFSVVWSPELGLFVAVAYFGTVQVMTSPNGFDWTGRSASEASEWVSVTWSPELGLFVAVADIGTNQVMTSPNGIDWTSRSASEASTWWSVVWSPELGLFVAVASQGTNLVMTSPDGINWTSRPSTGNQWWFSVTWSPELGLFVAVAYAIDPYPVMTSESISDYDRLGEELLKVVDHTKAVHDALGIDHVSLANKGTNTHIQIDTHISAAAPHSSHLKADGTVPLTADWDAGSFEVRAQTLEADVATGTAPLTITSTTKVTNLNADLLDGLHDTGYTRTTAGQTINVSTAAELTAALAALMAAPSLLGNVIIQLADGNYATSISIPPLDSHGFTLTIRGSTTTEVSTTMTGGTAGTINTQATVIKTGAGWTVNAYRGKWIQFTSGINNGKKRAINSNTADTLTLGGALLPAIPANNDTFIIYSNSASITGDNGVINPTTLEIIFQNINIMGMIMNNASLVRFIETKQTITGYNNHKRTMSTVWHRDSIFQNTADVSGIWMFGGVCTSDHCFYYEDVAGATFTWAFLNQGGAHLLSRNGEVFDGYAAQALWAAIGGTIQIDPTDSYGIEASTYCFVKNNVLGLRMEAGGGFLTLALTVFSGNTTNYLPAAAADPAFAI